MFRFLILSVILSGSLLASPWFHEYLHEDKDWQQDLKIDEMLYEGNTSFQNVKIFENAFFGKVLALDDVVQTTTRDEFFYHEMITHVPLLSHENPETVLIIGGGDGGVLREVLKHSCVKKAVQVEIDGKVVELCKEFLPELSKGAFEDARTDLRIGDGLAFVKNTEEKFDVIIVDSTDPIGPGIVLFSKEFYVDCAKILQKGGILTTQNGVPFVQEEEYVVTYKNRNDCFSHNRYYLSPVPTYVGGDLAYGFAANDPIIFTKEMLEKRMKERKIGDLKYYTPQVHITSFTLPEHLERLLD